MRLLDMRAEAQVEIARLKARLALEPYQMACAVCGHAASTCTGAAWLCAAHLKQTDLDG